MPFNMIKRRWENLAARISAKLIVVIFRKYGIPFIFEDRFGVITKRLLSDNIEYILRTGNSCDAAPLMSALDARLASFGTCFDVGANIGIVSAFLSRRAKVVYAFEPEPNNVQRLHATLALNNCRNVIVSEQGVSNRSGETDLYLLESYGHHSLGKVATSKITGKRQIQLTTIDDFCDAQKITFIDVLKVDVEGFEQEVFEGAQRMLAGKKIGLIAFEISRIPLESLGKTPNGILAALSSFGYCVEDLAGTPLTDASQFAHCDLFARPASAG